MSQRTMGLLWGQERRAAVIVILVPTLWLAARTLIYWAGYLLNPALTRRTDFALYYTFSEIGVRQGWAQLYDLDAQRQAYALVGPSQWFPLPYPPTVGWLVAPLTALSLEWAYVVWSALILASLVATWLLVTSGPALMRLLLLVLAACPYLAILALVEGQVIVIQMAAVALAWRLLRSRRDVAAGIALFPIVLHPQGLLLIPLLLLCLGRLRCLGTWLGTVAIAAGAVVLTTTPRGALLYLGRLHLANASPDQFWVAKGLVMTRLLSHPPLLALGCEAAVVVAVIWIGLRHRGPDIDVPLAAAIVGSLLTATFLHLDDLMILFLAGWLLLRRNSSPALGGMLAAGLGGGLLVTAEAPPQMQIILVVFEVLLLAFIALRLRPRGPGPGPAPLRVN